MASSPRTLAPDKVDRYFPSRETSTRPSVKQNVVRKSFNCLKDDKQFLCLDARCKKKKITFLSESDMYVAASRNPIPYVPI